MKTFDPLPESSMSLSIHVTLTPSGVARTNRMLTHLRTWAAEGCTNAGHATLTTALAADRLRPLARSGDSCTCSVIVTDDIVHGHGDAARYDRHLYTSFSAYAHGSTPEAGRRLLAARLLREGDVEEVEAR